MSEMRSLSGSSCVVGSNTYRHYALGMLAAVYMLNLVDRGLMMLLIEPIKADLELSDTQLGFVTGIAFALLYATLGVPIARWADSGNRVTIASLAIGVWGLAVMGMLWVTNYTQLVLARIVAAVGEAGCKPPTYSLVGDYFPQPTERVRGMAIYMTGAPMAAFVSFVLGGWLSERFGWRSTFCIMGIPGLILALLVRVTVREPRISRGRQQDEQHPPPPIRNVFTLIWQLPTLRHLTLALILLFTLSLGFGPWYAAFLIRSHGMSVGEIGLYLGFIFSFGSLVGVLGGGYVANRWFANNEAGQLKAASLSVAALVPCYAAFLIVPNRYASLTALVPLMAVLSFYVGPIYVLMQRLIADNMRATLMAIVMLLANLLGMGIGPQVVGILSDQFVPTAGTDSLRYAMLCLSFIALWAAIHFRYAAQHVANDLGRACGPPLEPDEMESPPFSTKESGR